MEFHEKLQELRRQRGLTQEELAGALYVSRTAVSKWESGRGYPNLDSLRAIAKFYGVTVDELLSSTEVLEIAEESEKQSGNHRRDLVYGFLDLTMSLLLLLPLFAGRVEGVIQPAVLWALEGVQPYVKVAYWVAVIGAILWGILTLALQNCAAGFWIRSKTVISLSIGVGAVLLFMLTSQPYAAVFGFSLLAAKAFMLIKRP